MFFFLSKCTPHYNTLLDIRNNTLLANKKTYIITIKEKCVDAHPKKKKKKKF